MAVATSNRTAARWARRVTAVTAITMFGRLIGFLFTALVLNHLDASDAGLAFFFINTAFFIVQPVSGGPAMAMVRPIAAASSDGERMSWLGAASVVLVPAVAVSFAVAAIACATSGAPVGPMLLMVACLSADAMYFQLLTARYRYTAAATYRLIANAVQLGALIIVLTGGIRSVNLIIAIFALSYLCGIAIVEPRQRVLVGVAQRAATVTRAQCWKLAATAIPTLATGLAYSGMVGVDTYLVRLHDPGQVAGYGAAKTLAAPYLLISFALVSILQPETAKVGPEHAMRLRRRVLAMGLGGSALAIVTCWAVSGLAVSIVYGQRYPEAATTLRWLGTAATLIGFHSLLQMWCWGRGRYVQPTVSLGIGAGVAVVCNLLLLPQLGAPGAGMAVLFGGLTALFLLVALSRGEETHENAAVRS